MLAGREVKKQDRVLRSLDLRMVKINLPLFSRGS